MPRLCGIYYLWDGAAVLYVSSSRDVYARVAEHCRGGLDFCGFFFDACDPAEMPQKEAAAIREFDPPYNQVYSPRR